MMNGLYKIYIVLFNLVSDSKCTYFYASDLFFADTFIFINLFHSLLNITGKLKVTMSELINE